MTIFIGELRNSPDRELALKNMLKRIKTIRHPLILKYIASAETEKALFIATEPVLSLSEYLQSEGSKDRHAILWLVHDLLV